MFVTMFIIMFIIMLFTMFITWVFTRFITRFSLGLFTRFLHGFNQVARPAALVVKEFLKEMIRPALNLLGFAQPAAGK